MKQLVKLKDKLRDEGKSVSWEKSDSKGKELAKDRARKARNEKLQDERIWNPKGYWSKMNQFMGEQKDQYQVWSRTRGKKSREQRR